LFSFKNVSKDYNVIIVSSYICVFFIVRIRPISNFFTKLTIKWLYLNLKNILKNSANVMIYFLTMTKRVHLPQIFVFWTKIFAFKYGIYLLFQSLIITLYLCTNYIIITSIDLIFKLPYHEDHKKCIIYRK